MASSKPISDFEVAIGKCDLCKEEEALYSCKDCQEELCEGCRAVHLRSKASSNHDVVSSSLSITDKTHRKRVKCHTHPKKTIRMYCKNCDEAVCVKCIADMKHENHSFEELESTIQRYKEQMSKNISDAKKRISELEKSLHKIDINVKDYNEASDKTIEDINKQRIQIKSNIDTIADNMANQVQKRREQDVQLMEKKGKDIQKVITEYKEYLTSCQEKSVDNIADFKHQLKKPAESNIHTIIHTNHLIFVGDNSMKFQDMFGKLVDLLDESKSKQKMPDSEKVQKKKPTTDDETDGILITTISTQELLKTNSDASRLHDIRCFYVSAVNDQKAWCGGLNEMILVGIHGNVQRKVTLDNYSCGLAVTSLGELLVTVTSMIKKYLPDGKCVDIANTKPYHSKGITLTSQGDILVCLCKSKYDNKVVRMTTAGHVKQTIQKNKQHQPLFTNPQHVAENVNGDVVVVDNNVHAFIVVTNKEGRLKYMYPDFEQSFHIIDECSGIACDSIGCILVSDYLNHKIHQIDIDGRFTQFILSEQEGIQLPWGLSIDNKGQLWLGNENGLEVTVYKYSS